MKRISLLIILLTIISTIFFYCIPEDSGDSGDGGSETYTLAINITPENSGTVTVSVGGNNLPQSSSYQIDKDAQITLTANPLATYKFVEWIGDVSGVTNVSPITLSMNTHKTITAKFSNDITPPSNVTGLTVEELSNKVILHWTDPTDADLSHISITYTPNAPSQPILVLAGLEEANITGLINGTTYTFTVKAVDESFNESIGVQITGTPALPTPPSIPTNVFASPGYNLTIRVSWDEVPLAEYYVIRWVQDSNTVPDDCTVGVDCGEVEVSGTQQTFWVDNDENGEGDPESIGNLFAFRVKAVNEGGESAFSPNSSPTSDDTYAYIGYVIRTTIAEDTTATISIDPNQKSYYNTAPYDVVQLMPNIGTNGGIWCGWSGIDYNDLTNLGGGIWSVTMNEDITLTANFPIPQELTVDNPIVSTGSVSSNDSYDMWYFDGIEGKEYRIWWDDNSLAGGSGTYTGDVVVAAYQEDITTGYWTSYGNDYADYGYGSSIKSVIIPAGETRVYIKVKCMNMQWNGTDWGTYAIKIMDISAPNIVLKDPADNTLAHNGTYTEPSIVNGANGVTTDLVFSIHNTGLTDLNLTGANYIEKVSGDVSNQFSVIQPSSGTISPSDNETFTVRFTGNGSVGTRSIVYKILSNDPDTPDYRFTVSVNVSLAYSEINLKDNDVKNIAKSGTYSCKANASNGTTKDLTFTIQNTGLVTDLTIDSITKSGTNSAMFDVQVSPTSPIPVNSSSTFVIRFTADGTTGIKIVTFTVNNNETGISSGLGDGVNEQAYTFTMNVDAKSGFTLVDNFNSYDTIDDATSWTYGTTDLSWVPVSGNNSDPVIDQDFAYYDNLSASFRSVRLGGDKGDSSGIIYNQRSFIETNLNVGSLTRIRLEFYFWASTETDDKLRIWVDANDDGIIQSGEIANVSGGYGISTNWKTDYSNIGDGINPIASDGNIKIRFFYEKDYGYSSGDDVVWIDNIYWYPN